MNVTRAFAREKLVTMEALGGEVGLVPSDGGKVTPALFGRTQDSCVYLDR